jgi:uridine phosphorylase
MFLSQTGNSLEYFNIKNLEMEGAMVMTITEMRELKEQSSRSTGSISGKEAGGIYIRGLLCSAR